MLLEALKWLGHAQGKQETNGNMFNELGKGIHHQRMTLDEVRRKDMMGCGFIAYVASNRVKWKSRTPEAC